MKTIDDVNTAIFTLKSLQTVEKNLGLLEGNPTLSFSSICNVVDRCAIAAAARPLVRQMVILLCQQAIAENKAKLLAMGIEVP